MDIRILEVNVDDNGMGGVFSFVRNVIRGKDNSIKIDIASLEPFENERNLSDLKGYGCDVYYVGRKGSQLIKQIHSIFKLISLQKNQHYDCAHIHSDLSVKLFIYGVACKVGGIKKILLHSHASGAEGKHLVLKTFTQQVFGKLLKFVGTDFLACSDLAGQWMYPNLNPSRIITVNNGIDLKKFRYNIDERNKVRNQLGLINNYVIGHVGRFSNVKNQSYLIDILNEAKDSIPNIKLLLIGEGPLIDEVKSKVDSLSLSNYVLFYGSATSVATLYQAMDIFVLPSLREGFPIVGVEAQASGLPVLFSDRITKTAKLIEDVAYLPIDDKSICKWVQTIIHFRSNKRRDTYYALKEKKFDISDTVSTLTNIYQSEVQLIYVK